MRTPFSPFPEITFPACAVVPPTTAPDDDWRISTPSNPFGRAARPDATVPMRLPSTCALPDAESTRTPVSWFPDMTLPGGAPVVAAGPPRVPPKRISTPTPFGTAEVPVMSVPTKLLWAVPPNSSTPNVELPETTLRAVAVDPPSVTFPAMAAPVRFGTAAVPAALVPIRFPLITVPAAWTWTPSGLPEMTFPGGAPGVLGV